ncbi:MAG: DNA methyltransferase [Dehalococcoidia bacterium]
MSPLIEDGFPFELVSEVAEAESWRKEIHRPVYHLHKWWAQRLGSVFRAILLGSALPADQALMDRFYQSADGLPELTVFDPFMGSGTTIGEALKLGFRAIGRDINPVAVNTVRVAMSQIDPEGLIEEFHRLEHLTRPEMRELYRAVDRDGEECQALYYFWVKQAECPGCGTHVDLFNDYIFARHAYAGRSPGAFATCPACSAVCPVLVTDEATTCDRCRTQFGLHEGPARGTGAKCPQCQLAFPIIAAIRNREGPPGHRMYAKLVLTSGGSKQYLAVDDLDLGTYGRAESQLTNSMYPLVALQEGHNTRQAINYGYNFWHQMFNARQLVAISVLNRAIAGICDEGLRSTFYLLLSGTLEFNNMFASYKGEGTGAVRHMFSHHVLKPERTPLEANLWGTPKSSGSFSTLFRSRLLRAIEYKNDPFEIKVRSGPKGNFSSKVGGINRPLRFNAASTFHEMTTVDKLYLSCGPSQTTDLDDDSVDLVVTDPPFFDNVHYSELADFFHVWQRHFLGDETIAETTRDWQEVQNRDAYTFSGNLSAVFRECHRVLKNDGMMVFTYHHSRDEGWRSIAEAIFSADFAFVAAQPVKAEMSVATPKATARDPIDIDSILVCRPWSSSDHDFPRDPALVAESQITRFGTIGKRLSRNDIRVIFMGQVLVEGSRLDTSGKALDYVRDWESKSGEVIDRLFASQSPAKKPTPQLALSI